MLKLVYIINELANSNSNINIVVAARELLILIKSLHANSSTNSNIY